MQAAQNALLRRFCLLGDETGWRWQQVSCLFELAISTPCQILLILLIFIWPSSTETQ
jgi:hypothetical protein